MTRQAKERGVGKAEAVGDKEGSAVGAADVELAAPSAGGAGGGRGGRHSSWGPEGEGKGKAEEGVGGAGERLEVMYALEGHAGRPVSVAWSPSGAHVASGGWDKGVRVWDARTGVQVRELEEGEVVVRVAWSPDGRWLAVRTWDMRVRVHDAAPSGAWRVVKELDTESHWDAALAWSPDGALLAAGADGSGVVRVWDARTWVLQGELRSHAGHVLSVAFSPDGARMATGGEDRLVKVWDTQGFKFVASLKGHEERVTSLAFYPTAPADAPVLASAARDGTVRVWSGTGKGGAAGGDTASGDKAAGAAGAAAHSSPASSTAPPSSTWARHRTLEAHASNAHIEALAFSGDGARLATASWDGTVKVWDTATWAVLQTLEPPGSHGYALCCAWAPDGHRLASSYQNCSVLIHGDSAAFCDIFTFAGKLKALESPKDSAANDAGNVPDDEAAAAAAAADAKKSSSAAAATTSKDEDMPEADVGGDEPME